MIRSKWSHTKNQNQEVQRKQKRLNWLNRSSI